MARFVSDLPNVGGFTLWFPLPIRLTAAVFIEKSIFCGFTLSALRLGDCIAANNSRRAVEARPGLAPVVKAQPTTHSSVLSNKENVPVLKQVSKKLTDIQEASIQSLIDKMQMGLDVSSPQLYQTTATVFGSCVPFAQD